MPPLCFLLAVILLPLLHTMMVYANADAAVVVLTHSFTPLNTPDKQKQIRRERAQIGQDLFSGQAAIPLQFPASFTFVFRAFTTLDGIGKTLDSGYDLTKIAGPYLKELLDLKDGNVYVSVLKDWQRKLGGWSRPSFFVQRMRFFLVLSLRDTEQSIYPF